MIMNESLKPIKFNVLKTDFISNVTADYVNDSSLLKELLVKQVCSRVRWRESINKSSEKCDTIIEIGSGKVLTGLNKRINRDLDLLNISNSEDIASFKFLWREFMRTILLTGATGGIGSAICRLMEKKYEVFVVARNEEKLRKLLENFKFLKGHFICDLSDHDQIKKMTNEISQKSINIDILVNNAGITKDSLFLRMDFEKWNSVINTNLNSNFLLTNLISKNMIKNRWGRIINITSVIGHTGNFGQTNYSASKAGIIGMSKSIALELAKRNITVNCIAPGFIETSMTSVLNDEQKKLIIEKIPLGTIGSPEDVANCVEFLASEKSRYITGQTIHVNGGLAML